MSENQLDSETKSGLADLKELAVDALAEAKRLGASDAEAELVTSSGLSATVRLGEVETIEHARDKGLGITVYFGRQKGAANTTDLSIDAMRKTVGAACSIARYTAADDCAGLAEAELLATEIPDLDLHHPWDLNPESALDLALRTEQAARDRDHRITNSEGATVARYEGTRVYANTHEFIGGYSSSRHRISCTVIAENATGMQRDYWYTVARDPAELEEPEVVGVQAAERAVRRLDARQLSTRTVPTIFAAEVATSLFGHLISAISGGNLYRRSSFLLEHLGKQVFPDWVRVHEEPHLKKALGSAPFDREGVSTSGRDLVAAGVLKGYVLNTYAARKLGMQSSGNAGGVHNLIVDYGRRDLDGLLMEMDTGLLVSELLGMGVNIVTGDYSRGAAGFWVENGQVQYPVQEITIAGNLRDMFQDIQDLGNDVEQRSNIRTGSVLLSRMTVAGG